MKFKSALIENVDHQKLYELSQCRNEALALVASSELERRIQVSEQIEQSKRKPKRKTAAQVVAQEQES